MNPLRVAAEPTRFEGEDAVALTCGDLSAVFLPDVGMTGVSLQYRGREFLALPGGPAAVRNGHTGGLPLLAPWANRLATRHYRVGRIDVSLRRLRLTTDANGLPIHGLLVGAPGWRVDELAARGDRARLAASIDVDHRAFPFPHRIEVVVDAHAAKLVVDTTVVPTGRRRVPVGFGWHPYLRLPGTPRSHWRLRLPAREHLALDPRGIPNGASHREAEESAPVGRRTFDDLYALGRDHRLAFEADDGAAVELHCGVGYRCAQVWVPAGRDFAALEPMTVPTNALVDGQTPLVSPGGSYRARFTLGVRAPGSSA
ncbi:MAG TPA: aldose 1-epimerase [Acidimicrobiia bacterium]|nr:aldose 1-epimerase [Acidimicrobiia bacterium]